MLWFLLASCVPIPVIAPPMRLGAVIGPTTPVPGNVSGPPAELNLEAGIAPLGVFPDLRERKWDPVVGGVLSLPVLNDAPLWRLGGYGQVRYRAWQYPVRGQRFLNAGPDAAIVISAPLETGGPLSVGLKLGGSFEYTGWGAGPSIGVGTDGGFLGFAWGEWSIGLQSSVLVRTTGNGLATGWMLGLVGNSPASAGIALVPLPL